MSSPLTPDEMRQYTKIIDHILKTSDLATVSRKKVRKGLELELDKDLSDQKDAIKTLIEQRFDAIAETQPAETQPAETMPTPPHINGTDISINGVKHEEEDADADADEDDAVNEIQVSTAPSKKRSSSMVEDEDARLAAQLQAQENQLARGRQTRGGHSTPKPKPKTKKKSKSSSKVKAGDDSDLDTEDSGTVKKRKAGGGFQKEFNLSYSLADLVGADKLSRPQVVKKLWEHIKANDLQEPQDKRQIRCDERMQAVFKQNSVNMFQMNKLIGSHLYPIEE